MIFTKNILNDAGDATINLNRMPGASGVSGSGTLVTLTFQAVGRGVATVSVPQFTARNSQGQPLVTASPLRDGYGEMRCAAKSQSGLTLVELIVAFTIMFLLTSMAVPLARCQGAAQTGARAALRAA